ncbi:MAG TPA: hypothetical protein VF595_04045, partial [Tepidisphaeraceae bacterium]
MSRCVNGSGLVALLCTASAFGGANETGLNVNYLYDSDNTPLLADVMRTYRTVNSISSPYHANDAALDANGWAKSDAWYFLGDPGTLKHADGTYAVKFNGTASILLGQTGGDGKVLNQTYDPLTNTTTALLQTKNDVDLTDVRFINTRRDLSSPTNTGVTNIQVMRPTTGGGSTPYSFDTMFTNQTKTIAQKVGVLRFMDYLAINNNTQKSWTERVKPTDVKLNPTMARSSRGRGGPLELAVQLGNEAGRDIWINVPAMADDDYVTKMAQLIKYGSDGVNPYTGPQKNPVFKPLNPNLKVYVEYSNETWNTSFLQFGHIRDLAKAEVASEAGTVGPMSVVPTTNEYYLTERYNALRTKEIADTFSNVFGDSAMLDTVRPILAWQYGNGNDTANQAVTVLDGYFNNAKGNFVSNPKPISSYIYGGGSAMYYSPTSPIPELTVDKIVTEPMVQSADRTKKIVRDVAYTTTFGIKRVAYEGGLSLDPGTSRETPESMAAKLGALADARLKQLVVKNHNTWTNQGGDLLVYYFATDQYKFGFTNDKFETDTPKLNGLEELTNTEATRDFSIGTPVSHTAATTIRGGNFTLRDTGGNPYEGGLGLKQTGWTSYLINIPEGGDFTLTAAFQTYGTNPASFELQLGGAVLADFSGLLSQGKYTNTAGILLTLPQGITSIRVLMNPGSGDISLNNIMLTPFATTPAVPEPASLTALALAGTALLRRRR